MKRDHCAILTYQYASKRHYEVWANVLLFKRLIQLRATYEEGYKIYKNLYIQKL